MTVHQTYDCLCVVVKTIIRSLSDMYRVLIKEAWRIHYYVIILYTRTQCTSRLLS